MLTLQAKKSTEARVIKAAQSVFLKMLRDSGTQLQYILIKHRLERV